MEKTNEDREMERRRMAAARDRDRIAKIVMFSVTLAWLVVVILWWFGILAVPLIKSLLLLSAAFLSFFIVVYLGQPVEPVEFSGLGLKFKGLAGRTVLWILCFVAIVAALRLAELL